MLARRAVLHTARPWPAACGIGGRRTFSSSGKGPGFVRWYNQQLEERPLVTKSLTSMLLVGAGDIVCQKLVEGNETFDPSRWARAAFLGGVWVGPVLHLWYNQLARLIPGSGIAVTLKRLILDQSVFAPTAIPTYLFLIMALEGRASEAPAKLRRDYLDTMIANWKLWIPAQFINFKCARARRARLWPTPRPTRPDPSPPQVCASAPPGLVGKHGVPGLEHVPELGCAQLHRRRPCGALRVRALAVAAPPPTPVHTNASDPQRRAAQRRTLRGQSRTGLARGSAARSVTVVACCSRSRFAPLRGTPDRRLDPAALLTELAPGARPYSAPRPVRVERPATMAAHRAAAARRNSTATASAAR